ncbi:uncharacterized protein LOC105445903 [Strongylocentrotus purpuratus]|uniref:YHYH domain-containing protein n=1 Tax=Strongylocentrotus purpuratus TaxID=7668 RepID=A0A7M7HPU0_STRPU|nr:uncharacterized protein LOC105445903 [Strongylocentrotus purpuratus]|eukprot:XP_011680342.1 PREDICTED: uncharacterized protein LOC105445903 [Strongylocentrotus purpuratus]
MMGNCKLTMLVLTACLFLNVFLNYVSCLTDDEINEFGARNHTDPNTGLQGFITIAEHNDDTYVVTSNGIPDHIAGPFALPDDVDDIREQDFEFYIPKNPTSSNAKYELPMGPVGLALNGVALFNPYAVGGTDAVITEEETFDECDGHPTPIDGIYHYHSSPFCVFSDRDNVPSTIIGVALDGFPIYGPNDENGNELYTADLDVCHGRYVEGKYRYHITEDFPYILGCFHGVVDSRNLRPNQVLPTVDTSGKASNIVHGSVTMVTVLTTLLVILF